MCKFKNLKSPNCLLNSANLWTEGLLKSSSILLKEESPFKLFHFQPLVSVFVLYATKKHKEFSFPTNPIKRLEFNSQNELLQQPDKRDKRFLEKACTATALMERNYLDVISFFFPPLKS